MDELLKRTSAYLDQGYSLAVSTQNREFLSKKRGVEPLLDLLESGENYSDCVIADKVVGKASAFLHVLLGVSKVYTKVASKPALQVYKDYNVIFFADMVVENIENRSKTDLCPMEKAVLNVQDVKFAYEIIKEKFTLLNKG